MKYIFHSDKRGFTLAEILIALVLLAILMSLLGQSMGQIIIGSQAIQENILGYREFVSLRRTLHRDMQNLQDRKTIRFETNGFTLTTSHCLMREHPLNVRVTWSFDENITRKEEIEDLEYSREVVLMEGVKSFELDIWEDRDDRWIDLDTVLLSSGSGELSQYYRNLRLTLNLNRATVTILERFPYEEHK